MTSARPFPWTCPHCRKKEIRRSTVPYQCERVFEGKSVLVIVPALAVPKCDNCGEMVFDYLAEEQINEAYQAKIKAMSNGREKVA